MNTVATSQLARRFGIQPDYSLGVEDELLLVDHTGTELRAEAERVIASAPPTRGRADARAHSRILIEGNVGDVQRSVDARGGMPELLSWLVRQRGTSQ